MAVVVHNSPDTRRYEAELDGSAAGFATYRERGDSIAILHTEVDPEFEGEGIGAALVGQVLADAKERGLAVLPFCPFANSYIRSHPEYLDLVPNSRRTDFGLPED